MSKRIEYLDSLRGLAAMQVLVYHYFLPFPAFWAAQNHERIPNPLIWVLTYTPLRLLWDGQQAVILFFVLSGFVLALPYFNGRTPFYPSYLIRRFFRIYVPYLFVVSFSSFLILFSLSKYPMAGTSDWFSSIWSHTVHFKEYLNLLLMTGGVPANVDGPAWSLDYEMRISLFFPLLCLLVLGLNRWTAVGWGCFLTVASLLILDHFPYLEEVTSTLYYSSFFIWGCILAKYKEDVQLFFRKFSTWQKVVLILAIACLYNLEWEIAAFRYFGFSIKHDRILSALGPGIAAVLIISAALAFENIQRILHHRFLLWVGKISYSLYLTHVVVLAAAIYFLPADLPLLGRVLLGAFLSFPVAAASYQCLEVPCIEIGHRLAKRFSSKRPFEPETILASPLAGESSSYL
jgi:peptidoglycan/LPS O-acetylase OafA/YrhL